MLYMLLLLLFINTYDGVITLKIKGGEKMRKQVIFLVTAFVFIIIMCGSVSAAENTTGGGNDDDSNVIISGQVLDCVTNQPFANASVTATGNGEEMAQTFSDQQGNYELKFFSNITQFNVTATYDGHKPSSQIVNTSEYSVNNTTIAYGNTNLSLGKPKAIFLFTSASAISNALMNALEMNPHFTSDVYLLKDMPVNLNLTNYDLVFFDYLWTSSPNLARVNPLIEEAKNANIPVIVTVTYYMTNPTNINLTEHPWIRQYWTSISPGNAVNLIKYMAVNFLGATDTYQAPANLTKVGIYHPDTNQIFSNLDSYLTWYTRYDPTKPTVALMFGQAVYNKANTLSVNAIIQGLESRGYNVIPYFLDHETYVLGQVDINTFLVANGAFLPDLVIHYRAAGWDMIRSYDETMAELIAMNVPIMKALSYESSYEAWLNASQGIGAATFAYSVTNGEKQGIIDPIVVATTETDSRGIPQTVPIARQIDWIIDRAVAQINLRYTANSNKKVAIVYWSSQPGLSSGVGGGHLDAYSSLITLLKALKDNGYNLGNNSIPNETELANLIRMQGSNIGNWAPGDLIKLVENYPVVLVQESKYLEWFNTLNAVKRQEVIDAWGEAPGNIMVYTKNGVRYIVLPVIQYGNIILAPEPSRGYTQSGDVMYHSGSIPPTHQYLAFYFWLNHEFDADAVINFGRHGTVAWLPGKSGTGLDCENDWPAIVSQDMPMIYLFTVEGSEYTLPRRRQGAVMISHLIPTMTVSGLYGNLTTLIQKLNDYFDQSIAPAIKEELKNSILELTAALHLDEDLNVNLTSITDFDQFADDLHEYLEELESEFITLGLHILGQPPSGDNSIYMIQSLLGYNFREYMNNHNITDDQVFSLLENIIYNGMTAEDAQISVLNQIESELTAYLNLAIIYMNYLALTTNEISSTLNALNGGYIPASNIGDPIINPEVLPTGNNMYSFDPRTIPTVEAWNVAVKLVDEMLASFFAQHGRYPEKIAFMLWATNSIQDRGIMEAQILYLMGLRPVRDTNGYVKGTEIIPDLGRPVIDVVVTTTSLYYNDFKSVLDILDNAVRSAYNLNGTNYVKIHSDSIYQMLISKGYDENTARTLSQSRIFSQEPGNHRNPLTEVTLAESGDNMAAVIDTFINTFGYLYGQNVNSQLLIDLYTAILNGSDLAVFSRNVNANDILGDDDYYAYFGGLGAAIGQITGTVPSMVINNLQNPNNPKTESLAESLARDLRTSYFNPVWIKALINQGPGAANRLHDITHLLAYELLIPGSTTSNQFQNIYDIYVRDSLNLGLNDYFKNNNPYTQQSIIYTLMQANHAGAWNADAETLKNLANRWAQSVIDNGYSGDMMDMKIVNKFLQNMDTMLVDGVKSNLHASTLNPAFAKSNPSNPNIPSNPQNPSNPSNPQQGGSTTNEGSSSPSETSTTGASSKSSSQSSSPSTQSNAGHTHEKAYEVTETTKTTPKQDFPYPAIVGIIAILALVGGGFLRGIRKPQ